MTIEEKRRKKAEYQKKYKLSEKGKITQQKYYHSKAHKDAAKRYQKKHLKNRYVYLLVRKAIQTGKLLKQPCEVCGKQNAFAHHDDYEKPLQVKWLCNYHHCEYHKSGGVK